MGGRRDHRGRGGCRRRLRAGAGLGLLARLVGPTGRVHAVDQDPQALALAREAAEAAGVTNIITSEGSATATGLGEGSVDVVMMRHVLAHNGGSEQAIVEHLATLVRPGGAVYLVDSESQAMRAYPADEVEGLLELLERYTRFHAQRGNDLSVGLRLGELLERAGLELVDYRGEYQVLRPMPGFRPPPWAARDEMVAAGIITEDDVARYEAEFERLDRGEVHTTVFIPMLSAWGRKPS